MKPSQILTVTLIRPTEDIYHSYIYNKVVIGNVIQDRISRQTIRVTLEVCVSEDRKIKNIHLTMGFNYIVIIMPSGNTVKTDVLLDCCLKNKLRFLLCVFITTIILHIQ